MFPKRPRLLLLLVLLMFSCKKEPFVPNSANALPGLWKQLGNFPGLGRVRSFGFTIGDKGYIIGGNVGDGFTTVLINDFWEYDAGSDKWTRKADYPGQAGEYIRGFSINGKGYVGTGFGQLHPEPGDEAPQNNDFWEYDPGKDKWTRKADFSGIERENVIAFAINGVGYMGLGTDNNYDKNYKDFWRYDAAADKWTRAADFPGSGSYGVAAFVAGAKGYAGLGGRTPIATGTDFWRYDPVADKWEPVAEFPGKGRAFSGQFAIGTNGYVGFGSTLTATAEDWFKYDTVADKWSKITNFPGAARYDMISFVINGIGYIGTGNPGQLNDFWRYTPKVQ